MDVSGRYSCINLELGEFHLVTEDDPGLKIVLGLEPLPMMASLLSKYHLVMTNSLPWKDPPFLIGKPSISIGHLYHGYVK